VFFVGIQIDGKVMHVSQTDLEQIEAE